MPFDLPILHRHGDLVLGRTGPAFFFPAYRLRVEQRTTHMYVLGITGQGKSKLLQHCLFQDITAGRGCGLLDPHSDFARDLMAQLAGTGFFGHPANQQRVVFFDPARTDYFIPFNVLDTGDPPYTTAINVIEAFRRTWPESLREAPRFTNILLASLLVLIANRLTLVDLPRLLTDKKFRESLLDNVNDPELISVFHDRMDRWGREEPLILESVLNKVSALTLNPILRAILGQRENKLNFRKIMDEGMVLIVDLGRCDSETRRLLGSLIVTTLEQAAISRKDEPQRNRRPFYFYIDEFQDFCANESSTMTLAHILSESRKFGLHLSLAHQTLGQMTSDRMQSALGNIGTKVIFAIDRYDAEVMAKKLFTVDAEKIKHEVEDEAHQDRTHPIFYSLQEGWEEAVQAIQALKPRTCLVKVPHRGVVKLHTIGVAERRLSEPKLDTLLQTLLKQKGSPYTSERNEIRAPISGTKTEALSYYEPAAPLERPRGQRLSVTDWAATNSSGSKTASPLKQIRQPEKTEGRERRSRKQ
jgi:Type IV secretion-system coupling protein DNA-binding domain